MRRTGRIFTLVALLAGVAGYLALNSLYAAVNDRGLFPLEHPGNVVLLAGSGLVLLLAAVLFWKGGRKEIRFCVAFPVEGIGLLAAAMGFGYSAFAFYDGFQIISLIRLLAALLFGAMAAYRLLGKKTPLLIPTVLCTVFLLLTFEQLRDAMQFTQPQRYLVQGLHAVLFSLYVLFWTLDQHKYRGVLKAFYIGTLYFSLVSLASERWPYYLAITLWLLSNLFYTPYKMVLPPEVKKCIRKLEEQGYTAYVVGGCVRDAMMGIPPHDYDLCTNATPEQICQVFSNYRLIHNGEKHGTVGVVLQDTVYEITTYRTEGGYQDNRHPDWVEFVDRVEDDLARRDFTVNAMAYNPATGYVDPYGGRQDLYDGYLRAVGDAPTRFREDALRILRGVRFACRFRLEIEETTRQAMEELAPLMDNLARERVLSEMTQILCHMQDDDLLRYQTILLQIVPELQPSVGFRQHNRHHRYDVFRHTAYVLTTTRQIPALRWAALLHDVGKPETFTRDEKGQGHFYGHASVSAEIADRVLQRLKASTSLREHVVFLVYHHMDEIVPDAAQLRKKLSKYGLMPMRLLIALQQADQCSKGTGEEDSRFEKLDKLLLRLNKEEGRLQIRDLAVNGHDLMALGFQPGPALGACQRQLLEQVLSGSLPNEREALLQKAQEYLQTMQ